MRSARPYFVDWVEGFDAYYGHVGGSEAGKNRARSLGDRDVDQFVNSSYYYRSTDRFAPHNVYTTNELLQEMMDDRGNVESDFKGFPRKEEAAAETPQARDITVNVSSGLYEVGYTYDSKTNSYLRRLGGTAHRDRETLEQINPKNVVVIKVATSFLANNRLGMTTVGSGDAWIFTDGNVTKGTWSKTARVNQIEFKTNGGASINLNPGSTWITAIPTTQSVDYKP